MLRYTELSNGKLIKMDFINAQTFAVLRPESERILCV